LFILSMPIRRW
jgi:hypothetical protein